MNTKVVDLTTNNISYKGYIGFFLPRLKVIWMPTLNVSRVLQKVKSVLQLGFQVFPLKIGNANLHESCVPHQDLQLS
jgi:hypothetical protein